MPLRRWAALLLAAPLLGCAGEGSPGFHTEPMRSLAGLTGSGWQVLPIGRFVTRDAVTPEVIEVCRPERCGFSAVVARVTVHDAEATALAASAGNAARLAALIRENDPDRRPPRPVKAAKPVAPSKPARVTAEPIGFGGWSGVSLAISGGPHARSAFGTVLERPSSEGVEAVIVVSDRPEVATHVAQSASAATVTP